MKIFIDGKLVCQVNNNAYSVRSLSEGKHKISVQYDGKNLKENADFVEIDVKKGTEYFVRTFKEGIAQHLKVEEITTSSWNKMKEGLVKDDCL